MAFKNEQRAPRYLRDAVGVRDKAASGDILWVLTPPTVAPVPTTSAWTRDVLVELKTAAGEVHDWFSADITTGVSIADDGGGTASIPSTTLTIVNGKAVITISGTEATWANGETDTLTVAEATVLGYTVAAKTSVEEFTT
jgi:hypothetical protein